MSLITCLVTSGTKEEVDQPRMKSAFETKVETDVNNDDERLEARSKASQNMLNAIGKKYKDLKAARCRSSSRAAPQQRL